MANTCLWPRTIYAGDLVVLLLNLIILLLLIIEQGNVYWIGGTDILKPNKAELMAFLTKVNRIACQCNFNQGMAIVITKISLLV